MSTKCTPGFACRAFSDTTLVCFIVNEHTTKCSHYTAAYWYNKYVYQPGICHLEIACGCVGVTVHFSIYVGVPLIFSLALILTLIGRPILADKIENIISINVNEGKLDI